jgi:hypothetical protein
LKEFIAKEWDPTFETRKRRSKGFLLHVRGRIPYLGLSLTFRLEKIDLTFELFIYRTYLDAASRRSLPRDKFSGYYPTKGSS